MKTRVYIVTDAGPVEVAGLYEEWEEGLPYVVAPNMCIHRSPEPQLVNDKYQLFVNPGTGLIAKEFGHKAPRLDLIGRIDTGDSWQLGATLAHALYSDDRLASSGEPADERLYITGVVDPVARTILPVAASSINAKYQHALAEIKKAAQMASESVAGSEGRVFSAKFILPDGNLNDLDHSQVEEDFLPVVSVAALNNAYQLISYPRPAVGGITKAPKAIVAWRSAAIFGLVGIIISGGLVALGMGLIKPSPELVKSPVFAVPSGSEKVPKQDTESETINEPSTGGKADGIIDSIQLAVRGQYARRGVFCSDGETFENTAVSINDSSLMPLSLVRLCRIEFTVTSAVDSRSDISVLAYNQNGLLSLNQGVDPYTWFLNAPPRKDSNKTYTLLLSDQALPPSFEEELTAALKSDSAQLSAFLSAFNVTQYTQQLTARF